VLNLALENLLSSAFDVGFSSEVYCSKIWNYVFLPSVATSTHQHEISHHATRVAADWNNFYLILIFKWYPSSLNCSIFLYSKS